MPAMLAMPHDDLTFGLAVIGFALLAADAARRVRGQRSRALTVGTAAVVGAHVVCVWTWRFGGSIQAMWSKSPLAFLLFHLALAGVLLATVAREPWRSRLVIGAFLVVCAGALPAPFRYPELALLRLPVLAIAAAALCYARPRPTR